MAIFALLLSTLFLSVWLMSEPWRQRRRRERLRARPFPEPWRRILRQRVPIYRRLPADLQGQLRGLIQVFLAEKAFIGCRGQAITDEVRVTIAAQACLLLLNRPAGREGYFPGLTQVLVYPGAFAVDRVRTAGAGVVQDQRQVLLGESWSQGQVLLSWQDSLDGAALPDDGHNLVVHEFAHQLDQENGHANGAPPLPSKARYARWSAVMQSEFNRLQAQAAVQASTLLNHYGASDPAEFFAVSTEVFFEQPQALLAEHPALYAELSRYYRVNPVDWH
jgi:Mlc titration factor MtfA (ptsG expression regulator)